MRILEKKINFNLKKLKLLLFFAQYVHFILTDKLQKATSLGAREVVYDSIYNQITKVLSIIALHSPLKFNAIRDVIAYDRPSYFLRFLMVYILRNVERDFNVRIRFSARSQLTVIPTSIFLLASAQWSERECFDGFGLKFFGNLDIRKILSDYSFWGFAGRKDFPLVGISAFVYSLIFLRVSKIRGNLNDLWSLFFQKTLLIARV